MASMRRVSADSGAMQMQQYSSGTSADSYPAFSFIQDTNTGMYLQGADSVGLTTGGVGRLIVDSVGNVGIGTGAPTAKLNVANTSPSD